MTEYWSQSGVDVSQRCRQKRPLWPLTSEWKRTGGPGDLGKTRPLRPVHWSNVTASSHSSTSKEEAVTRSPVSASYQFSWSSVKAFTFLCVSLVLGVDLLVEEVLRQHVEFPVFLSDGVRSDELELFQRKLVKLVLHLPNGRLLQLGNRLLGGRLLFAGLPQVGLLSCDEGEKKHV